MRHVLLSLILALTALPAWAGTLTPTQLAPNIWAIVGPLTQRAPDNLGNNATFGLVVTDKGAVLIDAGATTKGAAMLDNVIGTLTDKPVVAVINTGGQDHRWLGNSYWHRHGAQIIASTAAVEDQTARASMQMTALSQLVGAEALKGTEPYQADVLFTDGYDFELGGVRFNLIPTPGHTPGDAIVWLPDQKIVFTGDLVFSQRLLGVLDFSSSRNWVESFETMAALAPEIVVPGHGAPTDLATATQDTYDYLVNLRREIGTLIEDGGDILDAPNVDQSAFAGLGNFDTLAGRNAQAVFSEMEWE